MFDLTGNVAVVTGASVGLGRQFALALARQGADVAILARRKEKLAEVEKEVETLGVRCLPVGCDVTDVAQVQNAVQAVPVSYTHLSDEQAAALARKVREGRLYCAISNMLPQGYIPMPQVDLTGGDTSSPDKIDLKTLHEEQKKRAYIQEKDLKEVMEYPKTVSYTHLDVYKRQNKHMT